MVAKEKRLKIIIITITIIIILILLRKYNILRNKDVFQIFGVLLFLSCFLEGLSTIGGLLGNR